MSFLTDWTICASLAISQSKEFPGSLSLEAKKYGDSGIQHQKITPERKNIQTLAIFGTQFSIPACNLIHVCVLFCLPFQNLLKKSNQS